MDLTPEEKFKLLVVSDPPRSTVFLDGAELAERTPVEIPALDPGRHEIGIRAEGYLPFAQEVEVGPGQPAKIEAKLQSKMESYYLGSIREDPDTISNYTELAHHYVIVNKFGEAAAALTKALELACDKAADASHVARLHQEIRSIYYGSFDFGGAAALAEVRPMIERLLREAIRDRPAASAPYCLLSAIYMASGKLEKAEDVLRDGAQNARDKASLLLALAQVLYRQAKYEQAAVCLDQLLKEQERNVAARNLLAQVYQRLGKTDLAVQHRKLVADLGKSNPAAAIGALSCLAGFYQRKGDHARAAETWEKAASLQKDAALGAQYRMAAAGEYAQARKWDRAIALCQEVIQTTPDEALKSQATQQLEKARKRKR